MHPKSFLQGLAVSIILVGLTAPAHAVDGVKLINQSVATNGTASAADDPGFPVTLSRAGSYRLSGNLTVPDANTTAIEITADDVTLDLNGFAILGPTVCSGFPVSCSPTGTGAGVFAGSDNVTVINGTIRGMGGLGVELIGATNRIERVHAKSNGSVGIKGGVSTTVTGSKATENGSFGITADGGSIVTGNTARGNRGAGITVESGTTVSGNTAIFNAGAGINATSGSIVIGNSAQANAGFGLSLGSNAGYSQNALTSNNGGNANPQVSGGINGAQNVCGNDAVCP
jgi:hypothetical protein